MNIIYWNNDLTELYNITKEPSTITTISKINKEVNIIKNNCHILSLKPFDSFGFLKSSKRVTEPLYEHTRHTQAIYAKKVPYNKGRSISRAFSRFKNTQTIEIEKSKITHHCTKGFIFLVLADILIHIKRS
jgi:hypothetical protein